MFLLGNWKNYDELEENLSVEELVATLNAHNKKLRDEHVFLAALQGVDLEKEYSTKMDVTEMTPSETAQSGFGVGLGLGHAVQTINTQKSEVPVN